jgi:hypothetical protein
MFFEPAARLFLPRQTLYWSQPVFQRRHRIFFFFHFIQRVDLIDSGVNIFSNMKDQAIE